MKKFLFIMLFFAVISVLLTACNSDPVADKKKIQTDLESYSISKILSANERITDFEIEKRQTEKDKKTDVVWCNVKTEDESCAYEKKLVFTYGLYDEGGWKLDNVWVNSKSEWIITPLTGVSDEIIAASLNGISVTTENDIWNVTQDNVKIVSIDKHETDLEAKTDTVTATVKVDDVVEEASGQLVISYTFNDQWVLDSISGNDGFTAAKKPGLELTVSDETLINAISEQTFEFGVNNTQTITIKKDAVTDFTIESQGTSEKGRMQEYSSKCTLKTLYAEFDLDINISYYYDSNDGWVINPISVESECSSVNIAGKWTGQTFSRDSCELNITEMNTEGNIKATYALSGSNNYRYSYYLSGKIDLNTLKIELEAGEWIDKPVWSGADDISAQLNVDNLTITGIEGHHTFTITQ